MSYSSMVCWRSGVKHIAVLVVNHPFRAGITDKDLIIKVYSKPYFSPITEEESIRLLKDEHVFMIDEYLAELGQMFE